MTHWQTRISASGTFFLVSLIIQLALNAYITKEVRAQIRQGEVTRYEPRRPTTSPYLNLLRQDSGALPNYQAFVRPMQSQNAINQQNEASLQRQRLTVMQLETEATTRQRAAEIRQTGSSASFMEYSHYFPRFPGRGGRR
jgi:hypothetical protein